ncbi:hypothetical protein [Rhodopirellula baltica]
MDNLSSPPGYGGRSSITTMPQCGRAKCDTCDFDLEVVEGWDRVEGLYHTGCGVPLPVLARWVWCKRCGLSQAEDLPLRSDLENELWRTRWNCRQWGIDEWQFTRQATATLSASRKVHRKVLNGLLALIDQRKARPRCLGCGTDDFHEFSERLLKEGIGTIRHETCGGTITLELGSIWTGILECYPAYNAEGSRIGRFTPNHGNWMLETITEKTTNHRLQRSGGGRRIRDR